MAFTPKDWKDGAAGGTPITAAELNRVEQGVADATAAAEGAAPAAHKHDASDIETGTFSTARIPSLSIGKTTGLQAALDDKATAAALTALEARVAALETAGG